MKNKEKVLILNGVLTALSETLGIWKEEVKVKKDITAEEAVKSIDVVASRVIETIEAGQKAIEEKTYKDGVALIKKTTTAFLSPCETLAMIKEMTGLDVVLVAKVKNENNTKKKED